MTGYSDKKKVKFVVQMLCAGIITLGIGDFTVFGETTPIQVGDISYRAKVNGDVFGSESYDNVSDTHVKIVNATVSGNVRGASSQGKSATNSSVEIEKAGYIKGNVYGGYGNEKETNNQVITEGTIKGSVYGGYMENPRRKLDASKDSSVANNSVTVTGGTIGGKVLGGFADSFDKQWAKKVSSANAKANVVTIKGGTIGTSAKRSEVIGGRSLLQNTSGNKVEVSGGTVYGNILGGKSGDKGSSTKNSVTIKNGSIYGNVYGGYSDNGAVSGNSVTLYHSVSGNVYGGYSKKGKVSSNTLNIRDKNVSVKNVYNVKTMNFYLPQGTKNGDTLLKSHVVIPGGGTTVNAYANGGLNLKMGNSVYLVNGTIDSSKGKVSKGTVSLGVSKSVPVLYSQVTKNKKGDYIKLTIGKSNSSAKIPSSSNQKTSITKGTVTKDIYGGRGYGDNAQNNTVTISGGTITKNVIGGFSTYLYDSNKTSGYANENTVYIKKGTIGSSSKPSAVYGGYSYNNNTNKNRIDVSGGTVYGGVIAGKSGNSGSSTYNTANIKGGITYGNITGGESTSGTVTNNGVNVTGGTVKTLKNQTSRIVGGVSKDSDVTNNTVSINGGTVSVDAFGGYSTNGNAEANTVNISQALSGNVYGGYSVNGNALNNQINLYKGSSGKIYGGYSSTGGVTNNLLNMYGNAFSAKGIYNVDSINFYMPDTVSNGDILLQAPFTVPDAGTLINATAENSLNLKPGESIYLLRGAIDTIHGALGKGNISLGLPEDTPLLYHQWIEDKNSDYVKLTIGEATVAGVLNPENDFYFGFSNTDDVVDNVQTLSQHFSREHPNIKTIYGGYGEGNEVANNKVTVDQNTYTDSSDIIGGASFRSDTEVHHNSILQQDDYFEENLIGGLNQGAVYRPDAGGVHDNSVTLQSNESDIYSGVAGNKIAGGIGANVNVKNNHVYFKGSGWYRPDVYGGYAINSDAVENSVEITKQYKDNVVSPHEMKLYGAVYGGYSKHGNAMSNTINVDTWKSDTLMGNTYGGYSVNGDAIHNAVTLCGNTGENASLFGGFSQQGNAIGNTIKMTGVSSVYNQTFDRLFAHDNVVGGESQSNFGTVSDNNIELNNTTVYGYVAGGRNMDQSTNRRIGSVHDNTVNLSSTCLVNGDVVGGEAQSVPVYSNNVTIFANGSDHYFDGHDVYGGKAVSSNVEKNVVSASLGRFGTLYGGYSSTGNANKNKVVISGVERPADFEAQIGADAVIGGYSQKGNVQGNSVILNEGSMDYKKTHIEKIVGGFGNGSGKVDSNTVTLNGEYYKSYDYGYKKGQIVGGFSSGGGAVTNNRVNTYRAVYADVFGGYGNSGNLSGNKVSLTGGTVYGNVFGGYGAGNGTVKSNTVSLGANITGNVYGGYSNGKGNVTGNRINLSHSVAANIIGGYSKKGKVSGNTLGVQAVYNKTLTAKTISNIKNLNFYLPNNTKSGLTVLKANIVVPTEGTTVNVYANGGLNLKTGNSIYLLKGNINTKKGKMQKGKIYFGVSKKLSATYTQQTKNSKSDYIKLAFKGTGTKTPIKAVAKVEPVKTTAAVTIQPTIMKMSSMKLASVNNLLSSGNEQTVAVRAEPVSASINPDSLAVSKLAVQPTTKAMSTGQTMAANTVVITPKASANDIQSTTHVVEGLNPQTKSFVETSAFTAAMVADAANRLINDGMKNAANVVDAGYVEGDHGFVPYLVMSDNNMRYNTGSHIEADGWGLNGGLARKFANKSGEALVGVFAEHGSSDYDSYLDSGVHGSGDGKFTGGGIFAKQTNHSGFYYEGSLRAGRVHGTYTSNDFSIGELNGIHERVDYRTGYEAFHIGVGKMHQLNRHNVLDTYMRYLYSRQNDFNAEITTGEAYHFDDITSSRLVVGTRLTHAVNPWNNVYVGVGYQYEFDGDAMATYDGDSTLKPSLHGSSGMMELGWQVKPSKKSPFTVDLAVTGWTGKQEGVEFRLGTKWNF